MLQFVKDVTRPLRMWVSRQLLAWRICACRRNYRKVLAKLRLKYKNGSKIRVLFLVSELSKWKTQSLYDMLSQDSRFEVSLAVSCRADWWNHPEYEVLLKEYVEEFKKKGMNPVVVADFKTMRDIPLESFNPDIVFYNQPYDWRSGYLPCSVSRYALTFYVPYFVPTHADAPKHYDLEFHRTIFRFVQLNEAWAERFSSLMKEEKAGEVVGLGHTFFDNFEHAEKSVKGDLVVYAPHWSFDHPKNPNSSNIGTFLWNGREILNFARQHPEIKWVFKPHPALQWKLVQSGVMTEREMKDYYAAWKALGISYFGSDYGKLFKDSCALITDCGSFIAEYPPCGGAMIHLLSKTIKNPMHPINMKMYETFYRVRNIAEMEHVFDEVLIKRRDPKHDERMKAVRELNLIGNNAAKNILEHITDLLRV